MIEKLINLGIKKDEIEKFFNAVFNVSKNFDIFTNAGLLMSSETKEFIKFVAWV